MKIGDKKASKIVAFNGDVKKYTLAYFEALVADEAEKKAVDLQIKKRAVEESAKKRF